MLSSGTGTITDQYLPRRSVRFLLRFPFMFLFLVLLGFLVLVSFGEPGASGKMITVGHDNEEYSDIQHAVTMAEDGDTILVGKGSYLESVVINKPLTIIGAGMDVTKIDSLGKDNTVTITSNWVNFSGFKIAGAGGEGFAGILVTSNFNRISENNVTDNPFGICLIEANNNTIRNNICRFSLSKGILIDSASFNSIYSNLCDGNEDGIYLYNSRQNILWNNTCTTNQMGIELYRSENNILEINRCLRNSYHGIHHQSSGNNVLSYNICQENDQMGIDLGVNITNILTGNDRDQDGVVDEQDDFQTDISASRDADGDGYPDEWNSGWTEADSSSGLRLDSFPLDKKASIDTDGDGHPDEWNEEFLDLQSSLGLTIDEFPNDPDEWKDTDGDGYGDNEDDFPNTGSLHSYLRFFGSIFILITILTGVGMWERRLLVADCNHLVTECEQKREEAKAHTIAVDETLCTGAQQLIESGKLRKAREVLQKDRDELTASLNDYHLSIDLMAIVEENFRWADEHSFSYDSGLLEQAREKHTAGHYKGSIAFSKEAFTDIKKLKDHQKNLHRQIIQLETVIAEASRSLNTERIGESFEAMKSAFVDNRLDQATVIHDRLVSELDHLRKTAIPELMINDPKIISSDDGIMIQITLRNKGFAHARNIKIVSRDPRALVKHPKIRKIPSFETITTDISIRSDPDPGLPSDNSVHLEPGTMILPEQGEGPGEITGSKFGEIDPGSVSAEKIAGRSSPGSMDAVSDEGTIKLLLRCSDLTLEPQYENEIELHLSELLADTALEGAHDGTGDGSDFDPDSGRTGIREGASPGVLGGVAGGDRTGEEAGEMGSGVERGTGGDVERGRGKIE
jgi:parallel beta-helix repeat protein